ncbi:MAG: AAA family ATPase [Methylococcaceae bacterium]|nr:AAA family ATPase [Methylococcaceae bacterium]
MRILAIRGKNLASLADPFEIRLDSGVLQHVGLFAITGQTGAGKSTLLDALCLALYDKIPRLPDGHGVAVGHSGEQENLRVTSNDVRSILRKGTASAYAEVDFIGKDKTHYRARWEVSKARGKANGRLQPQEIILSQIASGQRLGQGKKNTLELISELIDLNFDQFRRSVLLAQGDFAAFLKAKKDERSSLLERITGTDIYSELSIAAFDRARREKDALAQITAAIQQQLPLADAERLQLQQQSTDSLGQLAAIEQHSQTNQQLLAWYAERSKRRTSAELAQSAYLQHQQAWAATEDDRSYLQKALAVTALRPVLGHYQTAAADDANAETQLKANMAELETATLSLHAATTERDAAVLGVHAAEQQYQHAQPLLKAARALDTRLEVLNTRLSDLSTEADRINQALAEAKQRQQQVQGQLDEKTLQHHQLSISITQQQALKPIAAEWQRWLAEIERYQSLNAERLAHQQQAQHLSTQLQQATPQLANLQHAIHSHQQHHQAQLAELEQLEALQPQATLDALFQQKEQLEQRLKQHSTALSLAQQAQTVQQEIASSQEQLVGCAQTLADANAQSLNLQQQSQHNGIALDEAQKALDLLHASSHKNAEAFRRLLLADQPCPVCGAVTHPWQDHTQTSPLLNEQTAAQAERVKALQTSKEALIKTLAELSQTVAQTTELQARLAQSLPLAHSQLARLTDDWQALAMSAYTSVALTDTNLVPSLTTASQQLNDSLTQLKSAEKAALAVQKQLKSVQDQLAASQLQAQQLAQDHNQLDKQIAQTSNDIAHLQQQILAKSQQLQAIVAVLQTPFAEVADWQSYLQTDGGQLAALVVAYQQTERQLLQVTADITALQQEQQLVAQSVTLNQQQADAKHTELGQQQTEYQALVYERNALLPSPIHRLSADDYELDLNQKLTTANNAQLQAQQQFAAAEKHHAQAQLQHQHGQQDCQRRRLALEQAQTELERALSQHAISLVQLHDLLSHDDTWLAAQSKTFQDLERGLQEASALVKVQQAACAQHEATAVALSEDQAMQIATELQEQKHLLHAQTQEYALLLREDDKKIAASQHLKAELDAQQARWQQWEGLNELIGSSNGAKFRIFAQSLTLEALLAHSNQHLDDFAKRYRLQRVPGSDLELQIIDQDMADDVRSVDDVGVTGELASILNSFEPSQNF